MLCLLKCSALPLVACLLAVALPAEQGPTEHAHVRSGLQASASREAYLLALPPDVLSYDAKVPTPNAGCWRFEQDDIATALPGPIQHNQTCALEGGEDWPQFRGPTGQGLYGAILPMHWSTTRNVAWKQPIPGAGWSSPIVYRRHVYLTTGVSVTGSPDGDQSLRVLCLDARTGKVVWDREVFHQSGAASPHIHPRNSHASPTPVADGGRLYVHFGHQGTACLDLTGTVLWRNTIHYAPWHGNGGSPVLAGGGLVFNCDGDDRQTVAALDRNTGKVLWLADRHSADDYKFSFGTPLLIATGGRQQLISPGSNTVGAYDPRSGREIWHVRYDGYSVVPRPVYGHGLVFVCTGYSTVTLLAIDPSGSGDVTRTHVVWKLRKSCVPHVSSPLLVDDELYLVSDTGVVSCLDSRTGKVHWQERVGGRHSASPLYAGGKVYLQDEDGVGIVLQAGKQFKVLARNALGERALASYAAADGALFIRSERHLYRIQDRGKCDCGTGQPGRMGPSQQHRAKSSPTCPPAPPKD
jgi:outer membrane protein assembly factor BamB